MLGETIKVLLLLGELVLELEKLLLLTLADGELLGGTLAALEGITTITIQLALVMTREPSERPLVAGGVARDVLLLSGLERRVTNPWPPALGGAPVSPSAMARAVVVKVARSGRKAAVLVNVVRSMLAEYE